MTTQSWFDNRLAVLATKHHKEKVIAPLFAQYLNVTVIVPSQLDTDQFGTFTREIQRIGTQIEAARQKAEFVFKLTEETLAIASEGAFFPHPSLPYIACNREIVLLLDRQHQLEIIAQAITTETNFAHQTVKTVDEALTFAQKIGFPEHGLVVMYEPNSQQNSEIFKGICQVDQLVEIVKFVLKNSPHRTAHLETDMRAMFNPTRLKIIEKATENLITKLHHPCPQCTCPGFEIVEQETGLPCSLCLAPTALIQAVIYQCQKCHFRQTIFWPEGHKLADPAQCEFCNP